jgi:lysophospholipase L1-like esterase
MGNVWGPLRAAIAAALGTAVAAAGAIAAPPAGALRTGVKTAAPAYYVAIGASEAVGFQPVPGQRHGAPSHRGYAEDLTTMEAGRWPGLSLIELGCPGITSVGALTGASPSLPGRSSAGGPVHCVYPAGSELATAVHLIRQRAGRTVLVTVDLGFNDVWPCLRHDSVNWTCLHAGLQGVRDSLPVILSRLRAAGGRHLLIVGLEHSDPFLAEILRGKVAFARKTEALIDRLNNVLAAIYTGAGALVADVPAAYGTDNRMPVQLPGHGTVPEGVARVCAFTWMCTPEHNLHPNDAGYRAIADAVAAAIATAPLLGSSPAGGNTG